MASWLRRNYFICKIYGISILFMCLLSFVVMPSAAQPYTKDSQGAIIKFPADQKAVYLLFSAHDFGEGGQHIAQTLKQYNAGGSFFFTGDFLRNKKNHKLIKKLIRDGHYIGSHSDRHLLYNDWVKRDSLLVTKQEFDTDLRNSLAELKLLNIKKGAWYLPPYEWYNDSIVEWSRAHGLTVINFTPGTGTNADYTTPDMKNYRSSDTLLQRLFEIERTKGLAGNLLLIHLGTDARRTDKFYHRLSVIISRLQARGYELKALPYLSK